MPMGKRNQEEQGAFWIASGDLPQSGGHPFYVQVNRLLDRVSASRSGSCTPSVQPTAFNALAVRVFRAAAGAARKPPARRALRRRACLNEQRSQPWPPNWSIISTHR